MKAKHKYLVLIGGPTASGKTSLSIELAKYFKTEIISADSRQFYKEISIGTAKPTSKELNSVDHHLIDSLSIFDNFSVGDFERAALNLINTIHCTNEVAIVVGGTGLYLKSLYHGLDKFPKEDPQHKIYYNSLFKSEGLESIQYELIKVDPIYAKQIDINNPHRIIRALSIYKTTGIPFSHFIKSHKPQRPFESIRIKTDLPRDILYRRINQRVDEMITNGLIEEAQRVYPYRHLNSLNTVGYKELFKYFDQEWSLEYAIDKIKQHTRNYAKRQITWFNNQDEWLSAKNKEQAIQHINSSIQSE